MTLRIAQLANFVGPVSGGMRVAIDALGKGYAEAGHERILVIPGKQDSTTETENGIVVEVRSPRISSDYRMVATPWRALNVLDRFNPTSVEVSDKWTLSPAARWARRRGIGSVLFSHERLDDMLAGWFRAQFGVETAVGALNRRLVKEFDAIVVTSDYAAEEFADLGADLVKVPLGVDLETFHPGAGTPRDDGVVKLCYVGRMSHEKNPELGMRVAQLFADERSVHHSESFERPQGVQARERILTGGRRRRHRGAGDADFPGRRTNPASCANGLSRRPHPADRHGCDARPGRDAGSAPYVGAAGSDRAVPCTRHDAGGTGIRASPDHTRCSDSRSQPRSDASRRCGSGHRNGCSRWAAPGLPPRPRDPLHR